MRSLILIYIAIPALLLLGSCAKSEKEPDEPPPAGSSAEFTWTPSGMSEVESDDAYYIPAFNNILAFTGGSNSIDINLSSLTVGSYSISASLGNSLDYSTSTATYSAKSGVVNITSVANSKISGNFSSTFTGGTLSGISGEFSNVPPK